MNKKLDNVVFSGNKKDTVWTVYYVYGKKKKRQFKIGGSNLVEFKKLVDEGSDADLYDLFEKVRKEEEKKELDKKQKEEKKQEEIDKKEREEWEAEERKIRDRKRNAKEKGVKTTDFCKTPEERQKLIYPCRKCDGCIEMLKEDWMPEKFCEEPCLFGCCEGCYYAPDWCFHCGAFMIDWGDGEEFRWGVSTDDIYGDHD